MQDDRKARPALLRQKDEGVEPDAVAHRHHGLEAVRGAHLTKDDTPSRRGNSRCLCVVLPVAVDTTPVIPPASPPYAGRRNRWLRTRRGSSGHRNVQRALQAGEARIAIVAGQPAGFGEFGGGAFGRSFEAHERRRSRRERPDAREWRCAPFRARRSPRRCAIAADAPARSGNRIVRYRDRGD